jgi:tRNA-modifying protein YgfZ
MFRLGILEGVAGTLQTAQPDAAEYAAATDGAGMIDRSERGKLALSGPEAVAFLDSVVSNDIAAIAAGSGADATLLTHKGRMLAELRVLRTEDELLLDTERIALQALFDALRQFAIGYQAELHKRTLETGLVSLLGRGVDAILEQPPPAEEHTHVLGAFAAVPVRAVRTRLGIDLLFESGEHQHVCAALEAAGVLPLSPATTECVRIEAGIPRFGIELDETTMPQEAGIHERAVSYSKGCYVGQETVARLYWKGKPNRELRGLRLSEPVEPGTALRQGEREVGALGSVTVSPRLGVIGLALVRREAEVGDVLAAGDGGAAATVVALPFGHDADEGR